MLPVAILAGGLATRLRPLSETVPKSLIEVAGRPFIAHQLDLLRRNGVERAVICAGYLAEMIEDYVGDGSRFGLHVQYSLDGPNLKGTAGALRNALPLLGDCFLTIYGDSYLPVDYRAIAQGFLDSGKEGLMTVFENAGQWDSSNVEFRDGTLLAYDKTNRTDRMKHIDYGLGGFRASAFAHSPAVPDLATVYQQLLHRGQLHAHEVETRFYEIGSFAGITDCDQFLQSTMSFTQKYLAEARTIIDQIDTAAIDNIVAILAQTREAKGRLFILGVGGSAANASHAVNDFRKIAGIECYAPTDNVSELTARTNDEGWDTVFSSWLKTSRIQASDTVFVLSVGGGSLEHNISPNLVKALQVAKEAKSKVVAIVGRDGGYTATVADACVIVPTVNPENTTPHAEAFQAVIWHLLVSHPDLKQAQTKWESTR